jgi:hypothetical protein
MVNEKTFESEGAYTGDHLDGITSNYLHFSRDVASKKGLFVAFRDEGSCMTIVEMNVTYSICPRLVELSTIQPSTVGRTGAVDVVGECVNNSISEGALPKRVCEPEGYWGRKLGGTCVCDKGYEVGNETENCEACEPGQFKSSASNSYCLPCPSNSNSSAHGASICNCTSGRYRTVMDPPEANCTGPADPPTNVSVSSVNSRNVSVAWTKPTEDGDRSDLEFILELLPPLQESTQTPLCNMSKIVVGLIPYTNYSIRVGSQNGVNKMLQQPAYSAYVNFRTKEDAPDDSPQNFSVTTGNRLLFNWDPPQKPNGIIVKYTVQYFRNETDMLQDKLIKIIDAPSTSTYVSGDFKTFVFQIRAHTSVGPGPFSALVKPILEEKKADDFPVTIAIIAGSAGGGVALIVIVIIIIICVIKVQSR